jgi:hypothetical protein
MESEAENTSPNGKRIVLIAEVNIELAHFLQCQALLLLFFQGRIMNLCCSSVPSFVVSITAATQV